MKASSPTGPPTHFPVRVAYIQVWATHRRHRAHQPPAPISWLASDSRLSPNALALQTHLRSDRTPRGVRLCCCLRARCLFLRFCMARRREMWNQDDLHHPSARRAYIPTLPDGCRVTRCFPPPSQPHPHDFGNCRRLLWPPHLFLCPHSCRNARVIVDSPSLGSFVPHRHRLSPLCGKFASAMQPQLKT